MTSQVPCEIFYTIAGEAFDISERHADHIAHTTAVLHIYTRDKGDIAATVPENTVRGVATELSIPIPIKKGRFFNSETYCLFLNDKQEVLTIDGQYLFPVLLMRDSSDYERLHIKFGQQYYPGKHQWQPVAPV
ncbi:hypothetical protein [Taibaiella koreensis]|uniref:hypothetical protein n=1 Tax=Taibaiella koreensis TaxID=1268548 RepID=UPI000E59E92A|nr:hypothetical protein [Taibaiella koreensis]